MLSKHLSAMRAGKAARRCPKWCPSVSCVTFFARDSHSRFAGAAGALDVGAEADDGVEFQLPGQAQGGALAAEPTTGHADTRLVLIFVAPILEGRCVPSPNAMLNLGTICERFASWQATILNLEALSRPDC